MWKGFALGLAVGLGVGWLVFRSGEAPSSGERPNASTSKGEAAAPGLSTAATPPAPPDATAEAAVPARRADALRTASPDDLHRRWNSSGNQVVHVKQGDAERLTVEEGRVLVERAREALRTGDTALFDAAVRGLARAEGDDVDRFLLDLMSDTSVSMPHALGRYFFEGLRDSRLPGIAKAARARFDAEMALGRGHWWGADGWLHLVAAQGDAGDVEWVRALATGAGRGSGQVRDKAREALARASSDAAVTAFEGLPDDARERHLDDWIEANPERGVAFLERELDGAGSSRLDQGTLWVFYARHAPEGRLPDLERRLLAAEGIAAKASALHATEALTRRGYDVSSLRPIAAHLLEWLRANADNPSPQVQEEKSRVLNAFERNRTFWTRETLDVLERAAPDAGATKEIRAHVASRWR
jgi:hypothetical protein